MNKSYVRVELDFVLTIMEWRRFPTTLQKIVFRWHLSSHWLLGLPWQIYTFIFVGFPSVRGQSKIAIFEGVKEKVWHKLQHLHRKNILNSWKGNSNWGCNPIFTHLHNKHSSNPKYNNPTSVPKPLAHYILSNFGGHLSLLPITTDYEPFNIIPLRDMRIQFKSLIR